MLRLIWLVVHSSGAVVWSVVRRSLEVLYLVSLCFYYTLQSLVFRFERGILSAENRAFLARLRQQQAEIRNLRH